MRLDDTSRYQGHLNSLAQHTQKSYQLQQQIASGNRAVRPSDDPALFQVHEQLSLRSQKLQTDQQFVGAQRNRLDNYDSSVGNLVDQIRQARTLVQQASNAPADPTQLSAFRDQMNNIINASAAALNSEVAGKFQFGGTKVDTPPFSVSATGVTYQGDGHFPGIPLPDGQTLKIGLDGQSITQSPNADYFGTLTSIRDQLSNGSINSGPALDQLNELETHLLQKRAEAGAASRYLDGLQSTMASEQTLTDTQLTEQTGMDLATGITQLLQNETEQQATMSVVSRQAKLSLVDYLR
ncbi:hypothetical protein JST97_25880 [bacterium]|nr:hypothetical protein [bacterium]